MSDQDYDLDEDEQDSTEQESGKNWRRDLERRAKKSDDHARVAQEAQRELAFYKAGLPMSDPRMAYFIKGYDGPNDADAIKKAAQDAGFVPPDEQDTAIEAEVAQHRQISDASAGAQVNGKLTQSDVLAMARKAGDAAPSGMKEQAYFAVLQDHGLTKMAQAPVK